jgi:DNA-binding LytR/AlgR family response regulator
MRIAICDDQAMILEQTRQSIKNYCTKHSFPCELVRFLSGEALLEHAQDFDLVFLDYEMPKLNGMATARILKEKSPDTLIVFLTSHPEMMPNAFEVRALRYLLKPLSDIELERCINAARKEIAPTEVILYDGDIQKVTSLRNVQYIEAAERGTTVRTRKETLTSRFTMSDWQSILPQDSFYRCHKSFYINLAFVDEIHKDYVKLHNDERVAISRRCKKEFQDKLFGFVRNNAV